MTTEDEKIKNYVAKKADVIFKNMTDEELVIFAEQTELSPLSKALLDRLKEVLDYGIFD